jgi:hypothetical protein
MSSINVFLAFGLRASCFCGLYSQDNVCIPDAETGMNNTSVKSRERIRKGFVCVV